MILITATLKKTRDLTYSKKKSIIAAIRHKTLHQTFFI